MKAPTNGSLEIDPSYLDASALVRLYVEEQTIEDLNKHLSGRRDLFTPALAITEFTSAVCRLRREGRLATVSSTRAYRKIAGDVREEAFQLLELTPEVHRRAEELLLASEGIELRAADALHLTMAFLSRCTTMITFDRRLAEASRQRGLAVFPES